MTLTDQNIRHLKPIFHGDRKWMGLFFGYDQGLVSGIKGLEGHKYSQSKKWGYIPKNKMNIDTISRLDNRNMRKRKDRIYIQYIRNLAYIQSLAIIKT